MGPYLQVSRNEEEPVWNHDSTIERNQSSIYETNCFV